MIPVMNRYAVLTATLCVSLFIPVMKAELKTDATTPSNKTTTDEAVHAHKVHDEYAEPIETIEPEDTGYYNDDDEDIALMAEDEYNDLDEQQSFDAAKAQHIAHSAHYLHKTVRDIIISGNNLISDEAILNYVPYSVGEVFDPRKTGMLIRNLYDKIKRFKNIQVFAEPLNNDEINLHIVVEEKPIIKEVVFKGNSAIQEKDLKKKIDFNIPAIEEAELKRYVRKIQKQYRDKSYHQAQVDGVLEIDEEGRARVIFTINEGSKTLVNRILFTGNHAISAKTLRSILYTREDWILSFMDNAGSYQPEKLEADKHMIETYYQNQGFLKAKVVNADVQMDKECNKFSITFHIEEGDCYTVSEVSVDGQGVLNDEYLKDNLPIRAGDTYSRDKIADSIKVLEMLWGNLGYIYAHIDPAIQPDEENCTVKIDFGADTGQKVILNKINIIGNKKTRDRVIRRRLLLEEGCLITHFGMEESKNRVESLGFFDVRDGVNWKLRRIDNEHADLDLLLKEIKTGSANLKLGFGGSTTSLTQPGGSASLGVEVADTNLFGSGLQFNFQGTLSKDEQNILFNITEPWLFDQPILGSFDLYHRRPSYDEFFNTEPVNEILTGGGLTIGFVSPKLYDAQVLLKGGIDSLHYEKKPKAYVRYVPNAALGTVEYQAVLDKLFKPVDFGWITLILSQDRRNNPMHPSKGIRWTVANRVGLTSLDSKVGFYKFDIDFHWWTPLIGDYDLIMHLRSYLGVIARFKDKLIPYRELFHIGGPASVRGWLFGQISPLFIRDSIGGKKAFFVNLELIFPVTADFSTKGLVFYDGGCGWDAPYAYEISPEFLRNNNFSYRHAVGVGVRLLKPAPIRIDWGFKLDRRKKLGEPSNEINFSMSYDW